MRPTLVVLTGPTGSGKSALALDLAKRFPLEIVGADSLQVFRKLNIGSAKPTPEELAQVPHHLIDVLNPDEDANAAWYAGKARKAVDEIRARGRHPLVVGGALFYLRALLRPPVTDTLFTVPVDDLAAAHRRLQTEDPAAAEKIHPNDRYRIERATALLDKGERPSDRWSAAAAQEPAFPVTMLSLALERKDLYDRLNRRIDRMFAAGLADETREVLQEFPAAEARLMRAIGYREALSLLKGKELFAGAIEKAKAASRQYAKRQLTWLKSEEGVRWLDPAEALEKASRVLQEVWKA